jgi:hypothetical protein
MSTTLTMGEIAKLARKVEPFRPFQVITILPQGKPNPKRQDAKRRFDLYRDGMTVQEYEHARAQGYCRPRKLPHAEHTAGHGGCISAAS